MKNALSSGLTHGVFAAVLLAVSTAALAKLPALSDEAKAKAAETAAKTAWTSKMDNYLLCKSQDKVAASYYKTALATGKPTKPAATVAPCADPGAFVYTPPEAAKPVEAAGAHSPAATAASPPSGKQADAIVNPAKKP
jgi:hypothetical protein